MKFRLRRKRKARRSLETLGEAVVDSIPFRCTGKSLGVGSWEPISDDGVIKLSDFSTTPVKPPSPGTSETSTYTTFSSLDAFEDASQRGGDGNALLDCSRSSSAAASSLRKLSEKILYRRVASSFLRVGDLQMSSHSTASGVSIENYHHPSSLPPPGIDRDEAEEWVALDDGAGSHAPIAPYAVQALAKFGMKTALDRTMWKAEAKTEKTLRTHAPAWEELVWPTSTANHDHVVHDHDHDDDPELATMIHLKGPIENLPPAEQQQQEVLVWSGNFVHGFYGSDLPAVRAAGLVGMAPRDLANLLMDSDRVKEYNPMSLGRSDLLVLQDEMNQDGPFGKSVTKICQSESQPPLIRKTMQFTSILHLQELQNDAGYLIVSRAVTQAPPKVIDANILRSEILMGVNVIRSVKGHPNKCFMINVNHIRSPMVPMFIAKKIGLSAASNFILDMRKSADSQKNPPSPPPTPPLENKSNQNEHIY